VGQVTAIEPFGRVIASHTRCRKETSHVQHIDLVDRNLQDVSVKTTARVGALPSDEIYTEDGACSTILTAEHTVAVTKSIASRALLGLLILIFDISQLPSPRNWQWRAIQWVSDALVRRLITPGLISSLPGRRIATLYLFFDKLP